MASVTPVYPSLRVDRVELYQGDRQQQSQFTNGAILNGQITGKQGKRFVLEVDGQKMLASSKTPLRVGQNLNLQVTTTKPTITLQILADPLTSQVGKSVHLLQGEGELVPKTLELASTLPENRLSPPTRQVLRFYADSMNSLLRAWADHSPTSANQEEHIIALIQRTFNGEKQNGIEELLSLLQTLNKSKSLNERSQTLIHGLLADLEAQEGSELGKLLFASAQPNADRQLAPLLEKLISLGQNGQSLAGLISSFMADSKASASPLLLRLIGLVVNLATSGEDSRETAVVRGQDIREFIDRLGTNLERLLAEGKTDQAATTLKSALLEIREQHSGNEALAREAAGLNSTIEAIQLLQVRLAQDSILLIPLPFPFLELGFLVVDRDSQKNTASLGEEGEKPTRYSLYLQLEGLGNLRIDLHQSADRTRLYFYAQDPERARFLAENRSELMQLMTATVPESIQFLTGAEDPVKILLARITDTTTTVLNTTA